MTIDKSLRKTVFAILCIFICHVASAEEFSLDYGARVVAGGGSGDFAPYYVSSLRHGRFTSAFNAVAEAMVSHRLDSTRRFSYGFGLDLIAGYASSNDYARVNPDGVWTEHGEHPARAWMHQLYADLKYRSVFLTVGAKEHESALLNNRLTSGDLVESGNSRPIPEARIGFIDFQNIPFTNGWVQIQGEIGYGRMLDSDWWDDRYNRNSYHITNGEWYNYKRCYFRTKPEMPFSVTLGMQAAVTFGGTMYSWYHGQQTGSRKFNLNFKSFVNALIPTPGGEDFYEGNHLGSWDFMARYRLPEGDELKAYFQWPWEDGSGIGRRNGWDGLWGIEYHSRCERPVSGVVVEYLDFTNQSGPQHYAPGDHPGTTIVTESTGADDYYNNQMYNAYAYYGMSIGTPALMAPIFNLDGYPAYVANRMRGFHIALEGNIMPGIKWRAKGGYRKGWGNAFMILSEPVYLTSVGVDVDWRIAAVKGLSLNAQVAIDRGTMPGNAFGAMVTVCYNGFVKL